MEKFTREKVTRSENNIPISLVFFVASGEFSLVFDALTRGRCLYDPFVCFYSQPRVTQHAREKIDRQKIKRIYY